MTSHVFNSELYSFAKDFFAGGVSAVVAKTASAPVERIKVLLQTQNMHPDIPMHLRYKGPMDCFVRVLREQGVLSLWRGNLTNLLRIFPYQAINLAFKDQFKLIFMKNARENNIIDIVWGNLASGGAAGASALLLTHPLDVIRTKLQADVARTRATRQYKGIIDCMRVIFTQTLTLAVGTMCYPFDTVKRRFMMQAEQPDNVITSITDKTGRQLTHYRSATNCFIRIVVDEGWFALYKGISVNLLRGVSGAFVLVAYDEMKFLMRNV